jgi:hypothetical protein
MMIILPSAPQLLEEMIPAITRAMWTTEEYAIKTFMSLWRRHTTLKIEPPHIAIAQ